MEANGQEKVTVDSKVDYLSITRTAAPAEKKFIFLSFQLKEEI